MRCILPSDVGGTQVALHGVRGVVPALPSSDKDNRQAETTLDRSFRSTADVALSRVCQAASVGSRLCLPGGIVRMNERRYRDPALHGVRGLVPAFRFSEVHLAAGTREVICHNALPSPPGLAQTGTIDAYRAANNLAAAGRRSRVPAASRGRMKERRDRDPALHGVRGLISAPRSSEVHLAAGTRAVICRSALPSPSTVSPRPRRLMPFERRTIWHRQAEGCDCLPRGGEARFDSVRSPGLGFCRSIFTRERHHASSPVRRGPSGRFRVSDFELFRPGGRLATVSRSQLDRNLQHESCVTDHILSHRTCRLGP